MRWRVRKFLSLCLSVCLPSLPLSLSRVQIKLREYSNNTRTTGTASGDGLRAQRHRADLAASVLECSSTVPCWIAPTWRVSQCLPSEIASFDLVIIDEASQSDVTALTALLRGKRILVVGDQKQVSPVAVGIRETSIRDLKSRLLASRHPYVEQILPGRSIFDLASTCFADSRVALCQHFCCVPRCIYSTVELSFLSQQATTSTTSVQERETLTCHYGYVRSVHPINNIQQLIHTNAIQVRTER